jgi:hypothetical protein
LFVSIVTLAVLAAGSQAASEPEMQAIDPEDDAQTPPLASQAVVDALDIKALWLVEEGLNFTVNWHVKKSMPAGATDRLEYNVRWNTVDAAFSAEVWRQQEDEQGGRLANQTGNCAHTNFPGAAPAHLRFNDTSSTISLVLPKSCIFKETNATTVVLETFRVTTWWCHMEDTPVVSNYCFESGDVDDAVGTKPFVMGSESIPVARPIGTAVRREQPAATSAAPSTSALPLIVVVVLVGVTAAIERGRRPPTEPKT